MATNNFIIMTINVFNNASGEANEEKVKGQEVIVEEEVTDSTLTSNPESSTLLLDLDEDTEKESQDLESNGSWEDDKSKSEPILHHSKETLRSILGQIVFPFFLAGCGTVGAGLILDNVTISPVFQEVPEIIILVPALLGLKGNIEMTLASRLSTEANMGMLMTSKSKFRHILGNLYLVQFQGITIGLIASLSPYWMGTLAASWHHALLLSASSVATMSIASFCLGVLMSVIVVISKNHDINPDNVAAPLAASIGDIVTLTLLFIISSVVHEKKDEFPWLASAILTFYILTLPLWLWLTFRHSFSRKVLIAPSTWLPIIGGMIISCFAGKIFDHSVKMFKNIAVFQPVMNGVGGNIAAVQASRISTFLHCNGILESVGQVKGVCANSLKTFYKGTHAKSALALLLLLIPGQVIFVAVIWFVHSDLSVSFVFITFYVAASVVQVLILLYLTSMLVPYFWKTGIDPDNAAIPCLTSMGDFLGTALLILAFQIMYLIHGEGDGGGLVYYFKSAN